MKKLFKILAYIALTIITVLVVTFFSLKYYVANNWKNYYTEREMTLMGDSIKNASKLTSEFYKAYDLIYPGAKNRTLSTFENKIALMIVSFGEIVPKGYSSCNCIKAAYDFENRFQPKLYAASWLMLAHGLEQKSSEIKCLDYLYSKPYVEALSISHFGKSIQELCFEEAVEFILLMRAPSYYSTNGYRLQSKVKGYLNN